MDDNVGSYLQFDIVYNLNIAYGSNHVASKSKLQALSMSLYEGNDSTNVVVLPVVFCAI